MPSDLFSRYWWCGNIGAILSRRDKRGKFCQMRHQPGHDSFLPLPPWSGLVKRAKLFCQLENPFESSPPGLHHKGFFTHAFVWQLGECVYPYLKQMRAAIPRPHEKGEAFPAPWNVNNLRPPAYEPKLHSLEENVKARLFLKTQHTKYCQFSLHELLGGN